MAEDSLNAKKMNVNRAGRQPLMRPGWFIKRNLRFTQHMVFEGGMFAGQAKGLRVVCEERFGADAVKGSIWNVMNCLPYRYVFFIGMKQDELVTLLSSEPDFCESKSILQEILEAKGCRVLFGVKFHPDLMMIESCCR